ncbi:endonuclease VII domain-containing protein [Rhodococcus sp. UNC363MFTsu5.1]|uniref:endonuclease VII domain-containing protein n=1 Tax=Rhodococcus sp. UNC363MFTsu5.1 TaxID=1449069 RepID=UPI0018CC46DB|nr:endonuclease VII domain-containing protein [Rhodococcus sp. UNC363MFTsu5.1]
MTVRRRNRSTAEAKRRQRVRLKYGLSGDEYDQMVKDQDSQCAICGVEAALVVDHDHSSGSVRQLLCSHCNTALGFLRDNPESADRAAEYLRRHAA